MNRSNIKLILVDPNYTLFKAFQEHFAYLPNVEVANCGFERLNTYYCLVSPANSFGMMDGGIDAAITKFFGIWHWLTTILSIHQNFSTALWLHLDNFRSGNTSIDLTLV